MQIRICSAWIICAFVLASCASTTKPIETAASVQTVEQGTSDAVNAPVESESAASTEGGVTNTEAGNSSVTTGSTSGAEEGASTAAESAGTSDLTASNAETGSTETVAPIEVLPPEPELTPVQKLLAASDFVAARQQALANLREGKTTDSSEFWGVVEQDPMLSHTLDEEVRPHGTNTISALGGGSTVSFKYKDSADETAKAALKPDQDLRQTMYRSGIAYYRMCQILGCSFDTPVTRPVRFTKADFNALYNASDSGKNKGYRSKFEHLIWAKEDGTTYLYAGYKEWISPFTQFPIEVTSAWSPYLKNPNKTVPELRDFLKKILEGGRPEAVKDLNKLVEYAGNMTTRNLLQQISDIILMDYLTNNWDRFSGVQSNYGANCHFQPGGLIGIDNDAAFPAWHAPRVERRLTLVEMFSRDLVNNLRMLDPDELLMHLFPNPTKEELNSFKRFKERRDSALKYIDGLIRKKGEENVLVF